MVDEALTSVFDLRKDDLSLLAQEIGRLAISSEQDFLDVGESLQKFYLRSQELAAQGRTAAELLSGEKIVEAVDRLRELVTRTTSYLEESQDRLDGTQSTLGRIANRLATARKTLAGFHQVVMWLRMLGVTTKIESARLPKGVRSFVFLADEVSRQSENIDEKSCEILGHIEVLARQITELVVKIEALKGEDRGRRIVERLRMSLDNLKEEQQSAGRAIQNLAVGSEETSQSLGEVVSAMQFHDIVRQRLGHVQEAVEALSNGPSLEEVHKVSALQAALLRQSRDDLISAVEQIKLNLEAAAEEVKTMSEQTKALLRSSEGGGLTFLAELDENIKVANSALTSQHQMVETLTAMMTAQAETIEGVTLFLRDVAAIGRSIKLIALNATIKAAQIGGAGRALDTLAQSIRQVSQEAREISAAVITALEEIGTLAHDLRSNLVGKGHDQEGLVDSLVQDLVGVLNLVTTTNNQAVSLLIEIDRAGRQLSEEVHRSVDSITVHHTMDQSLSQAISFLEEVAGNLVEPPSSRDSKALKETLKKLAGRYTMDSEREIHRAVVGARQAIPAPTEEKSKKTPQVGSALTDDPGDDEDFGDNVELF